jgi:hypothetical protein
MIRHSEKAVSSHHNWPIEVSGIFLILEQNKEDKMMKKTLLTVLAVLGVLFLGADANATPSSTYWTPCVIDIQPAGVTHLGIDNYFQLGGSQQFATDVGPEWGANVTKKIAVEYGFDVLTAQKDPLFFNAKIGYRDGVLGKGAPAVQIGLFDFGIKPHVTDFNIIYLVVGKTLPDGKTRLSAAGYYGNPCTLKDSAGKRQNTGWMVAFDRQLSKDGKWVLAGDYASGNNFIGGGGVGIYYYFTKDISLLAGPVWFNDAGINGSMKWTTQLDVNF